MKERFAQLARTRVAGVPVPVLFVVAVLLLAVFLHRRRAAGSNATSAQDSSALDTSTPIGAMANGGGYAGTDYSYPSTAGTGGTTASDVTGETVNGLLNPDAGGTTVTGDPTGEAAAPAQLTPPKVSPAKSTHPAGRHHPAKPPTHKTAKAKAPAKKTTVHRATPAAPKPAVHKTKAAPAHHHPAPAKAPKKAPAHKKPAHRTPARARLS